MTSIDKHSGPGASMLSCLTLNLHRERMRRGVHHGHFEHPVLKDPDRVKYIV